MEGEAFRLKMILKLLILKILIFIFWLLKDFKFFYFFLDIPPPVCYLIESIQTVTA